MESAGWSLPRSRILHFPPHCRQPGSNLPTSKTPRHGGPSHLSSLSTDGIGSIPFPQTSVPAVYHGEGPGLSLSHLIASLHPDRPPPHQQPENSKDLVAADIHREGLWVQPHGGHSYCLQSTANAGKPSLKPLGPQQQLKVALARPKTQS